MATFIVREIVDGDTFTVSGGWTWDGKTGSLVRPLGYNTPEQREPGYLEASNKLTKLIQGRQVDIPKATSVDTYGRLLAEVYYNDRNLADYFPEYKI